MWQDALEPIYLQNNRHTETYMALLCSELIMTYCDIDFLVLLHHINICLLLRVKIILFWC